MTRNGAGALVDGVPHRGTPSGNPPSGPAAPGTTGAAAAGYPSTYYFRSETVQRRGEWLLMLATLEDGIRTILEGAKRGVPAKCIADDVAWLASDDRLGPFSFLNPCDFLGIDPDYLRSRVLRDHMRRSPPAPRPALPPAATTTRLRSVRPDRQH